MNLENKARILALALVFFIALVVGMVSSAFGQLPDLKKFEYLARNEQIAFFVNAKDAKAKDSIVIFDGLAANFQADGEGGFALNNQAWVVTTFQVDCDKRTAFKIKDKGIWKGLIVNEEFKPVVEKVEKTDPPRMIYLAMERVCKKIGLVAE
jgi:hypothetical protein